MQALKGLLYAHGLIQAMCSSTSERNLGFQEKYENIDISFVRRLAFTVKA